MKPNSLSKVLIHAVLPLAILAGGCAQESPAVTAYREYHRAMVAGNVAKIKASVVPGKVAQLEALEPAQVQRIIQTMQQLRPDDVETRGVHVNNGKRALVQVRAGFFGDALGVVTMVKVGNTWLVESEKWNNKAFAAEPDKGSDT